MTTKPMTSDTIESLREQLAALRAEHAVELSAKQAEHEAALYMPGQYKCPKCGFELTKSIMYVKSGGIGPNLSQPEPCPNDGETMRRVTWQEASQSNYDFAKKLLDERDALTQRAEAAEARIATAEKERDAALHEQKCCHEIYDGIRIALGCKDLSEGYTPISTHVAQMVQRAEAAEAQVVALRTGLVQCFEHFGREIKSMDLNESAERGVQWISHDTAKLLDKTAAHYAHLTTIDKAELAGLEADRERLGAIKPGWKFDLDRGAYGHPDHCDHWYIYTSDWSRPIGEGGTLRDAIDETMQAEAKEGGK